MLCAKAAPLTFLLLLIGESVLAQGKPTPKHEKISIGEILLYVALIVGIVLIAWFFGAGQAKSDHHHGDVHNHKKHFDHPNDPHFRKLKKKTS